MRKKLYCHKKREQRQAQKEKMHQMTNNMSKEEAKAFLTAIKKHKDELKQKIRKAMGHGQVFMVDMVYEGNMNDKENRSLGKQV